MIDNFLIVLGEWPTIAWGFATTVWVSALSIALSLILSIALFVAIASGNRWLTIPLRAFVDLMRAIPFLMLVFLAYYCLPLAGVRLSSWTCGLVSLVAYNTAYFTEILRGAWAHMSAEQADAGRAFGYAGLRLYSRIILPQTLIASGPMLGNQAITLIKNSAFLMVITVHELTFAVNQIQSIYFTPLEALLVGVTLYWVLCLVVEAAVRRLDRIAAVRGSA
ncbi:MAG: amino acid ABC transporter permease [Alphaproteobacteria bacterium]|nr:amino acid ABC transporter permease [Alphaproteobacteria bacterium]